MAFQNALKQFVSTLDTDYAKGNVDFFIGFEGSFGNRHVTPRTLISRFLSNLVCVEGIVTKCNTFNCHINYSVEFTFTILIIDCCTIGSLVRPKIVRSVHYCSATKSVMERAYTDLTSYDAFPGSAVYPTAVCNIYMCYL